MASTNLLESRRVFRLFDPNRCHYNSLPRTRERSWGMEALR